jgi:hypothetical protein
MPEPIQISIEYLEKNAAAIADVQKKLGGINDSTKAIATQQETMTKKFQTSWANIAGAIQVGTQAFIAVKKIVDETVGSFVTYADQVRTISQVTGASATETSRMIQVTDDYKIKTESLTLVMKKLATEGVTLTTDALADLSDQYLKLNPGVERQLFLTEKFGRAGADFAEIMLAGGDAIREKSAAVSDSLILDQQAIDKAREYEIAMDNLSDATEGLKIKIGSALVPALTELINVTLAATTDMGWLKDLMSGDLSSAADKAAAALAAVGFEMGKQIEKSPSLIKSLTDLKTPFDDAAAAAEDLSAQLNAIVSGANMFDDQTQGMIDAVNAMKQAEMDYVDYKKANPQDTSGIEAMRDKWIEAAGAVNDLQDAQDKQTKAWLANILLQLLSQETLSQAEYDYYLQYLVNTGQMTQAGADYASAEYANMTTAYDAFKLAEGGANDLKEAINNIKSKEVKITADNGQALQAIDDIDKGMSKLKDKTVSVTVNTYTHTYALAQGGAFSGVAMVGDAPGGKVTPYTEYVVGSGVVYTQAQAQSAGITGGGNMQSFAGGMDTQTRPTKNSMGMSQNTGFMNQNGMSNQQFIRELAQAIKFELAALL